MRRYKFHNSAEIRIRISFRGQSYPDTDSAIGIKIPFLWIQDPGFVSQVTRDRFFNFLSLFYYHLFYDTVHREENDQKLMSTINRKIFCRWSKVKKKIFAPAQPNQCGSRIKCLIADRTGILLKKLVCNIKWSKLSKTCMYGTDYFCAVDPNSF